MSNLEDIFRRVRQEAEDLSFPVVHCWSTDHPGGKVIGHFPIYFPEKIVEASGMLPLSSTAQEDTMNTGQNQSYERYRNEFGE